MIGTTDWSFAKAQEEGKKRGYRLSGLYDYAPNYDNTEEAIIEVLTGFHKVGPSMTQFTWGKSNFNYLKGNFYLHFVGFLFCHS